MKAIELIFAFGLPVSGERVLACNEWMNESGARIDIIGSHVKPVENSVKYTVDQRGYISAFYAGETWLVIHSQKEDGVVGLRSMSGRYVSVRDALAQRTGPHPSAGLASHMTGGISQQIASSGCVDSDLVVETPFITQLPPVLVTRSGATSSQFWMSAAVGPAFDVITERERISGCQKTLLGCLEKNKNAHEIVTNGCATAAGALATVPGWGALMGVAAGAACIYASQVIKERLDNQCWQELASCGNSGSPN